MSTPAVPTRQLANAVVGVGILSWKVNQRPEGEGHSRSVLDSPRLGLRCFALHFLLTQPRIASLTFG
jgi:hypothetical protein